jgi:hypothetical protein
MSPTNVADASCQRVIGRAGITAGPSPFEIDY